MTTLIYCLSALSLVSLGCAMYLSVSQQRTSTSTTEQVSALYREVLESHERMIETLCSSFFPKQPEAVSEPDQPMLAWETFNSEQMLSEEERYAMGSWTTNGQARRTIEQALDDNYGPQI